VSARAWHVTACAVGFVAVALGAFGAHGLKARASVEGLAWWETAARYAAYHALALLAVAWVADRAPSRAATIAGASFVAGVLLFSGSLSIMTLTEVKRLGMITPFGGLALLVGWVALGVAGWSALRKEGSS
jgi:uncharacterized membrane protein YgdD (TMEM256/DUF423 family)